MFAVYENYRSINQNLNEAQTFFKNKLVLLIRSYRQIKRDVKSINDKHLISVKISTIKTS